MSCKIQIDDLVQPDQPLITISAQSSIEKRV